MTSNSMAKKTEWSMGSAKPSRLITGGKKILLMAVLLLSACSLTPQSGRIDTGLQARVPGMIVAPLPIGPGYYAQLEKVAGHWQTVGDLSEKPLTRTQDTREILFISRSLNSVAPAFQAEDRRNEVTICTPYLQDDTTDPYGLCHSQFSTPLVGVSVVRTLASCVLTFCLGANVTVILDHPRVEQAVIESGLIDKVRQLQSTTSARPIH